MKQTALYSIRPAVMAAVLSLFLAVPAMAAEGVGRVLAASGTVIASTQGGGTRVLTSDSHVYQGEVIETRDGRVQIRFIDGGLMTLDPGTRFEIEQYEQRDAAAGDADDGGSIFMNFLSGALRTITGVIGDGENETYNLKTPVATVGIRGTQFSLEMCRDGSCGDDVRDGLYGHIGEGMVTVRNEGGDDLFRSGSFFRVSGPDQRPVQILEPPGFVLRGALGEAMARAGDGEGNGETVRSLYNALVGRVGDEDILDGATIAEFSESEDTGADAVDPVDPVVPKSVTLLDGALVATGFVRSGIGDGGVCVSGLDCSAGIDSDAKLAATDAGSSTILVGTDATLASSGTVSSIGAQWGRWSGEMVVDGGDTSGDLLWAYSNLASTDTQLQAAFASGSPLYGTVAGPSPVGDLNGDQWDATLSVQFLFGNGVATVSARDVNLSLFGPGNDDVLLENPSLIIIDPNTGALGFDTALTDTTGGQDSGNLSAQFAGTSGEGLLVQFDAVNASSGENIQGVQILQPQ